MASMKATWSPSSPQLRLASSSGNCQRYPIILLRARVGRLDRRVRVLCVANDEARNGNGFEGRRNGGSWVGSDSTADGLSGWSDSDNGEQSHDSQRKWLGGGVGAGVAGVVLFAGLAFATLSFSKCSSFRPKQQMEPLSTQQEVLLSSDAHNDQTTEPVHQNSNLKQEDLEDQICAYKDPPSYEFKEILSEIRVDDDSDKATQSVQDIKQTSLVADAVKNASSQEDLQLESATEDKSVVPDVSSRLPDLPESENIADSFIGSSLKDFDSNLAVATEESTSGPKEDSVNVETSSLSENDANPSHLNASHLDEMARSSGSESPSLSINPSGSGAHPPYDTTHGNVSVNSQSSATLEPDTLHKDDLESVVSPLAKEDPHSSRIPQLSDEQNYDEINRSRLEASDPRILFSAAGVPAPSVVSAALQVFPGKVLVPAAVDQVQGQALAALQVLKVIEPDVQPGSLCTRREYARWLVSASGALSRNTISKVYPAMYIENVTELAFDDITPEDPDFSSIQGLAEAGLIASRLSMRDINLSPDENQCPFNFSPESPLSRQDLVSWKMTLEKRLLPEADSKKLYELSGFIDIDKIHPDACPALVADLAAGEHGIVALAFGYTRLFQPDKPVTKAQAAIALAAGEASDIVNEELARIEAESMAENAVAAHSALVAQVEKDINASFEKELSVEREKINAVKRLAEEARTELERIRAEREEDNIALLKERAAVDSEMELLSRLRREVEDQLESLMSNKVEVSYEKERISKLREQADIENQEIARLQYELEVERKALTMARAWAEDEAKRAREQARALEEARDRWEKHGIKVVVDDDLREEASAGVTWLNAGKQFSAQGTVERAENLMDKLKAMTADVSGKSRDVINKIIQSISILISNLRVWASEAGKQAEELRDAAISKAGKSAKELWRSTQEFSLTVKDGAKRVAGDCREGVEKLTQRFRT
ncbi:Chloroplast thylakoid membrane, putative isoform 1 [Quillaja saponaria]|uniref:Chloroplast thylakoid membrane, putative isoform 1 n=1 Tax=Quillaja saponaria TaxID=32244 RepID=A0AAD7M4Q6_QUISA|nr:Chloroplast thylakoid membrane, putative isoform 1 [Quillaja saponaria]